MAASSSGIADSPFQLFSRLYKHIHDLGVAEKVFGLLALLVAITGLLATTSFQSVRLQAEYRQLLATSSSAAVHIGRVNALIYAVVMESRGIYMSTERAKIKQFSEELLKRNRELAGVVAEWKATVRDDDADQFRAFEERIEQFIDFVESWCGVRLRWVRRRGANGATTRTTAICGPRSTRISNLSPEFTRSVRKRSQSWVTSIDMRPGIYLLWVLRLSCSLGLLSW
jgi:hypothetical protein